MTQAELEKLIEALKNPSSSIGRIHGREPIFPDLNYSALTKDAKCYLARFLLLESCSSIGAGSTNGDLLHFLKSFAEELDDAPYNEPFGLRFKEHIAYAVGMVARSRCTDPPAAIASIFLLTRLEILFRKLSGVLNPDGTWIDSSSQSKLASAIRDKRLNRPYINDVALAYKVLMQNKTSSTVSALREIDVTIPSFTAMGSKGKMETISDIGERVGYMRQPSAHGFYSDASSEAWFYALVMATIYFSI